MKTAVVGSRGLTQIDIAAYLPENTTMIISGGAREGFLHSRRRVSPPAAGIKKPACVY